VVRLDRLGLSPRGGCGLLGGGRGSPKIETALVHLRASGVLKRVKQLRAVGRNRGSPARYYYRCYHIVVAVTKRSVSLDDDVASRVEQAAGEDGVSFSAWLSNAAEHTLLLRDGMQGVQEWEAEAGRLTATERAAGEALLDRLLGDSIAKSA